MHIRLASWHSPGLLCPAVGLVREKVLASADKADADVGNKEIKKILSYKNKGIDMKVIVTAQGNELSSEIDLRFGRAKWLILFDTETDEFKAHDNELNLNAAQGAGIQTGQNIANLSADVVITGNIGPNAFKTLSAVNVKVFLAQKQTVQQAIDSYKTGELKEVSQANVKGHWV